MPNIASLFLLDGMARSLADLYLIASIGHLEVKTDNNGHKYVRFEDNSSLTYRNNRLIRG